MSTDDQSTHAPGLTRRAFLAASGGVAGMSWIALQMPQVLAVAEAAAAAREVNAAFLTLSSAEAAGLEAIAARIIPGDELPGAREVGVIHFIDRALGDFMAASAEELRKGLAALDARAAARLDGAVFAALDAEAQDALLGEVEQTPFFELMHYLTIAGMFSLPSYGGNRDFLGWQLLGFEHRHVWAAPFGHYDAEAGSEDAPDAGDVGGRHHG